jgi:hypothetical protein
MTLDEMVQEVYARTNRPDLSDVTLSAVRSATIKAHQTDYYSKDIWETGIDFGTASYRQSWDYMTSFSNFRAFKYLRLAEDANDDTGPFMDIITAEETLDSYGQNRTNVAYVAGRVIEIRASCAFQYMLTGCYVFPLVTQVNFASWIADMHPYAIINEACRVVFKMIGYDEQSAQYNALVGEEYAILKITGLADVGS